MIQKHLERVNKVFNQLAILPEVRKEILLNLVPVEDDKFDLAISLVSREAAKAFENLDFVLCWGIAHFEPDVALQLREVVIFNLATGLIVELIFVCWPMQAETKHPQAGLRTLLIRLTLVISSFSSAFARMLPRF